jgi:hypothetical protein
MVELRAGAMLALSVRRCWMLRTIARLCAAGDSVALYTPRLRVRLRISLARVRGTSAGCKFRLSTPKNWFQNPLNESDAGAPAADKNQTLGTLMVASARCSKPVFHSALERGTQARHTISKSEDTRSVEDGDGGDRLNPYDASDLAMRASCHGNFCEQPARAGCP